MRLLILLLVVTAAAHAQPVVTLTHVHGFAYSPDGKRLMIPSHHGVAVYEKGKWSKAPGAQHDYMGFSATAANLYSSGHPAAAYVLGLAFGFGWTPCIGPVLGAILTMSAVQSSVSGGMVLLSSYAAGLGVPFLIAAVFMREIVGRLGALRRAGRWLQAAAELRGSADSLQ